MENENFPKFHSILTSTTEAAIELITNSNHNNNNNNNNNNYSNINFLKKIQYINLTLIKNYTSIKNNINNGSNFSFLLNSEEYSAIDNNHRNFNDYDNNNNNNNNNNNDENISRIATERKIEIVTNYSENNYWALLALILIFGTAAGNILVCLAIAWERRLQNVTNYFLMSLAITDLMVAILVMPLGILTLFVGYFPLQSEHCLVWICLDVLFCTASIMHLCTIAIDRYLSLRYPMRFGRNKTRKRVTLKIIFVWLLSIAMSLPLSLMYSKDHASVLVNGTCQIPDPVYKLVGSIVCFYIPLAVMLITYCLTVRLLAQQRQNLGGTHTPSSGWGSGWLGQAPQMERRCTWKRLLKTGNSSTPTHGHSATSTDTELSNLDSHELWLPDSSLPEPTPSTMTALHQFGAEMLKLSRGLESVSLGTTQSKIQHSPTESSTQDQIKSRELTNDSSHEECLDVHAKHEPSSIKLKKNIYFKSKRRASTSTPGDKYVEHNVSEQVPFPLTTSNFCRRRYHSLPKNAFSHYDNKYKEYEDLKNNISISMSNSKIKNHEIRHCYDENRHMGSACDYLALPPPCTCPYFGDRPLSIKQTDVKIVAANKLQDTNTFTTVASTCTTTINNNLISNSNVTISSSPILKKTSPCSPTDAVNYLLIPSPPVRKLSYSKTVSVVTWDSTKRKRRGSSFGGAKTSLLTSTQTIGSGSPLRRSATLRSHNNLNYEHLKSHKMPSSPCLLQRNSTLRPHHSRNSSVISRNSSRHGRIIRLEQKATKVLGVVFFTFVILWAPFFVLNLLPTVCGDCEENISHWVFDVVTWLGYASSMVNPIFYTIFNKVFRQTFKKVLLCKYGFGSNRTGSNSNWKTNR